MTPEERCTRLENLMQSVIEMQAHLSETLSETQAQFSERQDKLAERQEQQQILVEQDRAAIRDLIARR